MKVLPTAGIEVAAACLARPRDRLNVNKVEDIADVNALLTETCPYLQPMIETDHERCEIIVRFYDANANGEILTLNGLPSIRNYTRFLVEPGQPLDGSAIKQRIDDHIGALTKRIESEVGLKILPVKAGAAPAAN
jgi:hypothetical protein